MGKQRKKTILIDVIDLETSKEEAFTRLLELESLVETYGSIVVLKTIQKRSLPNYKTYIGEGKLKEIIEDAKEREVNLIVINNILKSRQIFNIEEKCREAGLKDIKVWDRVDLILKIFAKHAKSTEAKLQIELASIKHMGPRIFNMGIELMQQTGGIGLRGGQGETNIELMKRHLTKQELNIKKKLNHYEAIHKGRRDRRRRQNFKTLALVGYTNAGKSSLLNSLTKKGAYVADQLFATLDTRVGKLYLTEAKKEVLISDTIGFIQDLPPDLIQAFKSTLAETIDSDVILHVIDITDPQIGMKIEVVEKILEQLEVHKKSKIYVFNKTDLAQNPNLIKKEFNPEKRKDYPGILKAGKETTALLGWENIEKIKMELAKKRINNPATLKKKYKKFTPVFVSAHKKTGFADLLKEIQKHL